jgi:predicted nucleotidyltransferase
VGTTIADALFTRTQQRVLGLLFGEPERSFFASEIFRRAGLGRGSVQRELQRLVGSGLAQVTQVGNQKHYRANPDSPVFAELRSLILKTSGLAEPLREALGALSKQIELALIIGSVARGDVHAHSDIDLLVVSRELTLERLFARLARAEETIGRSIHPVLLTPAEFRRRRRERSPFLTKVLSHETIPLIGTLDVDS